MIPALTEHPVTVKQRLLYIVLNYILAGNCVNLEIFHFTSI
ncbi:hypothetical protein HMPREF1548_00725 [Clostridium sp. KLE 1755]|nr:hypothetical protein HMPREF1548_00725 [Clostridium sp. KLE 1755]